MPSKNSRQEDDRLVRVEEKVIQLYSKVTNGLSERTKRTEKMVEELKDSQNEFEKAFLNHLAADEQAQHNMTIALTAVSTSIAALTKTQAGWLKAKNRAQYILIASLVSLVGFVIMHSEQIARIVNLLEKGL